MDRCNKFKFSIKTVSKILPLSLNLQQLLQRPSSSSQVPAAQTAQHSNTVFQLWIIQTALRSLPYSDKYKMCGTGQVAYAH